MIAEALLRRSMIAPMLSALLLATPAASLSQDTPRTPDEIEGRRWAIGDYFDPDDRLAVALFYGRAAVRDRRAHMVLKEGRLSGSTGCGRLSGDYAISNGWISVEAVWDEGSQACSAHDRRLAFLVVKAMNGRWLLESQEDETFLTDPSARTRFDTSQRRIGLRLEEPGRDFSEFWNAWWRIERIAGVAEPSGVVQLNRHAAEVVAPGCGGYFPLNYPAGVRTVETASRMGGRQCLARDRDTWAPTATVLGFRDAVSAMVSYEVSGDILSGTNAKGEEVIRLRRIPHGGLEHRPWRIHAYEAEGALRVADVGLLTDTTFVGGELRGSSGCGGWSGGYELDGDRLHLQDVNSLLAGTCAPYDWREAEFIIEAMSKVVRVERRGDRMALLGRRGKVKILLAEPHDTQGSPGPVDRLAKVVEPAPPRRGLFGWRRR